MEVDNRINVFSYSYVKISDLKTIKNHTIVGTGQE